MENPPPGCLIRKAQKLRESIKIACSRETRTGHCPFGPSHSLTSSADQNRYSDISIGTVCRYRVTIAEQGAKPSNSPNQEIALQPHNRTNLFVLFRTGKEQLQRYSISAIRSEIKYLDCNQHVTSPERIHV